MFVTSSCGPKRVFFFTSPRMSWVQTRITLQWRHWPSRHYISLYTGWQSYPLQNCHNLPQQQVSKEHKSLRKRKWSFSLAVNCRWTWSTRQATYSGLSSSSTPCAHSAHKFTSPYMQHVVYNIRLCKIPLNVFFKNNMFPCTAVFFWPQCMSSFLFSKLIASIVPGQLFFFLWFWESLLQEVTLFLHFRIRIRIL